MTTDNLRAEVAAAAGRIRAVLLGTVGAHTATDGPGYLKALEDVLRYLDGDLGALRQFLGPDPAFAAPPVVDASTTDDALRAACRRLYDAFGCGRQPHPYIVGIGRGDGRISVMLRRAVMGHERPLPEAWEGFPVETRVTGDFRLLGGGG